MINFKLIFLVIILQNVCTIYSKLSDKRLCVDPECKEPISKAKTLTRYFAPEEGILSFSPQVDAIVYSHGAGSNPNLWGIEINGKRGYAPKEFLRETKILKKPTKVVYTEHNVPLSADIDEKSSSEYSKIEPNQARKPHEVIDGTTIFIDDDIMPSSTGSPVHASVTPSSAASSEETKPLESIEIKEKSLETKSLESSEINENILNAKPLETVEVKEAGVGSKPLESIENKEAGAEKIVEEKSGLFSKIGNLIGFDDQEDDDDDDEDFNGDEEDENEKDSEEDEVDEAEVSIELEVDPKNAESQPVEEKINIEIVKNATHKEEIVKVEEIKNVEKEETKDGTIEVVEIVRSDNENKVESNVETVTNGTENDFKKKEVLEAPNKDVPKIEESAAVIPALEIQENINVSQNFQAVSSEINITAGGSNNIEHVPLIVDTLDVTNVASENKSNNLNIETVIAEEKVVLVQEDTETLTTNGSVLLPEVTTVDATEDLLYDVPDVTPDPMREIRTEDSKLVESTSANDLISDVAETEASAVVELSTEEILNSEEHKDTEDLTRNDTNISVEVETISPKDSTEEVKASDEIESSIETTATETTIEQPKELLTSAEVEKEREKQTDQDNPNGLFSGVYSKLFGGDEVIDKVENVENADGDIKPVVVEYQENVAEALVPQLPLEQESCVADTTLAHCTEEHKSEFLDNISSMNFEFLTLSYDALGALVITAITVLLFLLGYFFLDKSRSEGPLIARINELEKDLLIALKENEILLENNRSDAAEEVDNGSKYELEQVTQELEGLQSIKVALEEQIQTLEKELENSTEVGLELNRMLTDILSSQNGSDTLIANVEQLQRQLIEQQATINSVNESLSVKDTETHELNLELEISNKKVTELQTELDKMVLNLLKVEEEKDNQQSVLEHEIATLRRDLERLNDGHKAENAQLRNESVLLKSQLSDIHRQLELKTNEFNLLKESVKELKSIKNNSETIKSLLDVNSFKAELTQLRKDNQMLTERLQQEQESKYMFEKQAEVAIQEAQRMRDRFDEADKEKLKTQTELQVLSNYFKEKEADLQKKLSKHENMWMEKQGENTSTVERIKFMQEELQNYKAQNESLKQEIVAQEVELKGQISVLEKKAHENWVMARQAERRSEDAKQEAAQLRNRLTLRERTLNDEKGSNRIQSPIGQNGDLAISPMHGPVDSPASPPLLYGARDRMTTSPPLPGLPPFMPPPPGVPFMPPPLPGVPPFMPPPPALFPGDHRPPPLGRMSSPPPLNSRYSPDSRYSPYDRNTPSPPYDSEYGASPPPMHRGYSPYNSRDDGRDYKRPPPARNINSRSNKGPTMSSGSGNSNESLEKINRHRGKI